MNGKHVMESARELVVEEGPMTADEIAGRLAETGAAVAVISPECIEEYDRDGETVKLVRGGTHMAISTRALENRMRKQMTGLRKNGDGTWRAVDILEEEMEGLA